MKPIKMLGLAALAALMAMALVGASSAMAGNTQLCTVDENPCGAGHAVTHIHESTLPGNQALLLNPLGNVKCDVLFLSTSVGGLAAPQHVEGHLTYANCKRKKPIGEENCTVTEKAGTPALLEVLRTSAETGVVAGEGEVNVQCGSIINCTYNGESLIGVAFGALKSAEGNGEVVLENQAVHKLPGGICPSEATLDIITTPLEPTYLSQ